MISRVTFLWQTCYFFISRSLIIKNLLILIKQLPGSLIRSARHEPSNFETTMIWTDSIQFLEEQLFEAIFQQSYVSPKSKQKIDQLLLKPVFLCDTNHRVINDDSLWKSIWWSLEHRIAFYQLQILWKPCTNMRISKRQGIKSFIKPVIICWNLTFDYLPSIDLHSKEKKNLGWWDSHFWKNSTIHQRINFGTKSRMMAFNNCVISYDFSSFILWSSEIFGTKSHTFPLYLNFDPIV